MYLYIFIDTHTYICLYILSDYNITHNYFFLLYGLYFCFLIVSFEINIFFNFLSPIYLIFSFLIVFLVSYLGNHSLIQDSEYLYLCFLKESWVSVLIFKSLIHFEYIFVLVESFCPSIICWHYFTVYLSWNSCWRSVEIICFYFWTFSSICLNYMSVLVPYYTVLIT